MTMNYCGRCGSANGTSARYCRQCGADLSSQSAFSTPSVPLNVEFSTPSFRNPNKEKARERGSDAESLPPGGAMEPGSGSPAQDPVAISQSLKRVRASGPLIIEAVKKSQDDMKQIFTQGAEGAEKGDSQASQGVIPGGAARVVAEKPVEKPAEVMIPAGGARLSRTSLPFSGPVGRGGGGSVPPSGPSSVLAQASGLNPKSGLGPKIRIALIAMLLMVATGTYFIFRDILLKPHSVPGDNRDLMRVEDQSAELVREGEREREQGNYDAALDRFSMALQLTPNNPTVHFLIAQTYSSCGRVNEAMESYKSVLRIAPENLEARLQVASIHRSRGNWAGAYQEYQRIITLDQNSVQAAMALEALEQHQEIDKTEALTARSRGQQKLAESRNPVLPTMPVNKGEVSLLAPKLDVTPANPPAVINLPPSDEKPDPRAMADARKKLGLRLYNVKEYRASINEFLAALRLTPDDKDIYYFLGSAYYGLGQNALAYEYFRRVDKGQYVSVAQSGAKRTEKAAVEESRRRNDLNRNNGAASSPKGPGSGVKQ